MKTRERGELAVALLAYDLDNQLTPSRAVVKIDMDDLLPGSQSQSLLHEGHG